MSQIHYESDDFPSKGGASSLEVAAWHLQVLLVSIAGYDGKIMFLTALNVAGISALIGIEITAEPPVWAIGVGLAGTGLCVFVGLGSLWTAGVKQFPTPENALSFARESDVGDNTIAWRHFFAVEDAIRHADVALSRQKTIMRALLLLTPIALAVVVIAAMTA